MPVAGDFTIIVKAPDTGKRLDILIASQFDTCSRSRAADLILSKKIRVNGALKKPGYRIKTGDKICGRIPPPAAISLVPEPIDIDIIYEDPDIILINKPPGLVVHPAAGHYSGTLVNALLYHRPGIFNFGGEFRPGIIHRLDKDTSGVLVVAKNTDAYVHLASQFKSRKVKKKYLALLYGEMRTETGVISLPIGRHPVDRKRMSTISRQGREAESHWKVRKRFAGVTLVEWNLKTGRTHQIRVHCAAINHPIVGDPVYCPRRLLKNISKNFPAISPDIAAGLQSVKRQMLHAWRLELSHPTSNNTVTFEAPLAPDFMEITKRLIHFRRWG